MSAQIESTSALRSVALRLTHHPAAEGLAGYAMGDGSPGTAFLVAQHIGMCAKCAAAVGAMGASPPTPWVAPSGATWLDLCPGVEISPLMEASGVGEVVFQIRAAAGARLPAAIAARIDELVVLAGGFLHRGQAAGVGDFCLPALAAEGELVASRNGGFYGLFTASDEVWDDGRCAPGLPPRHCRPHAP